MIVIYKSLNILINLIEVLILIRILLSFINIKLNSFIGELVFTMTEPILSLARNLINKLNIKTGYLDFSPIIAILFLRILASIAKRIVFF